MEHRISSFAAVVTALALLGCGNSSGPGGSNTISFDPPSTDAVTALGIAPPVNGDQAMAIAAEATGGTALGVTQETEGGELFFEVQVQTSSGNKEVEIRASDGGVVEIEPADGD